MLTPHRGGIVDRTFYPNGKATWRCAACGRVGPWTDGWGGWWSILDEESNTGLLADDMTNHIVWCSQPCSDLLSPWRLPVTEVRVSRKRTH